MPMYRKKALQELNPWTAETDMKGVSVSDADKNNGSPMDGDMIATNPEDATDKWLVGSKFFQDNYELAE